MLAASGAGGFAWWQIRNTPLANTDAGRELHEIYCHSRLASLVHEREIAHVSELLHSAGIEAVLVKGWAIAHRYPDRGLRPYGDIDLCIRPDQFDAACAVLKCLEEMEGHWVDLHAGFSEVGRSRRQGQAAGGRNEEWDQVLARSKVQSPKSNPFSPNDDSGPWALDFGLRVLSDEDHLRLLCVHMLRSGLRRPLWLCDVALLVEQTSPKSKVQSPMSSVGTQTLDIGPWTLDSSFDWNACLGSNPVHAEWVGLALALARELLGADISHTPFANHEAPRWIVNEVLEQWGGKARPKFKVQSPKSVYPTRTLDFGHRTLDLYRRWDNPIRATAAVGGRFTDRPQLRYRVAELIARLPELRTMSSRFF